MYKFYLYEPNLNIYNFWFTSESLNSTNFFQHGEEKGRKGES